MFDLEAIKKIIRAFIASKDRYTSIEVDDTEKRFPSINTIVKKFNKSGEDIGVSTEKDRKLVWFRKRGKNG